MRHNIITKRDSYKVEHWRQAPKGTERTYSYAEARAGAKYPYTVFFGLQYLIKEYLVGVQVTQEKIEHAAALSEAHFGSTEFFDRAMWEHILHNYGGKLPLRIRAVPEGTPVPVDNILMDVENLDDYTAGLTNGLESLLLHFWSPSTIATVSRTTKEMFADFLALSAMGSGGINFMLHDFGYRGVSSDESAGIGGAGHIINFMGTDTLVAMEVAHDYYGAPLTGLAYSVAATEHSIMTSLGREGESELVGQLLKKHPTGILSMVADSFDYYNFVDVIVGQTYHDEIVTRDGVVVVRPDSVTKTHTTPEALMVWTFDSLAKNFGFTENEKGYKVLNAKIGALWGDGIEQDGIRKILVALMEAGYSVEKAVFGMGGGLLQKNNRDTQRFAFKSSAQRRNGVWYDIFKDPLDSSKKSKRGRLSLVKDDVTGAFKTVPQSEAGNYKSGDLLVTVFENGELIKEYTFDEVRANAALK